MFISNKGKLVSMCIACFSPLLFAQNVLDGYLLLGAPASTYLVDNDKKVVKEWKHTDGGSGGMGMSMAGYSVYLHTNGNLIRPGSSKLSGLSVAGGTGMVQEIDPSGKVVWQFDHKGTDYVIHHDIEPMPNGHVLATVANKKKRQDAQTKGFTANADVTIDYIIEIDPKAAGGPKIVWEWHMWDHIIPAAQKAANPDMISTDANTSGGGFGGSSDFSHLNGIGYNPKLDHIVISFRYANEVLVIDHSTTTEEAKTNKGGKSGKGGRILYRWGNPANYGLQGTAKFSILHATSYVPEGFPGAGNIMVLNNNDKSRNNSQVYEIAPPMDANGKYIRNEGAAFGPENPIIAFQGDGFFTTRGGNGTKLANGNILSCEAGGGGFGSSEGSDVREATPSGTVVWKYTPTVTVQNARKYAKTYPGIVALLFPSNTHQQLHASAAKTTIKTVARAVHFSNVQVKHLEFFNVKGEKVSDAFPEHSEFILNTSQFAPGSYIAKISTGSASQSCRFNVCNN